MHKRTTSKSAPLKAIPQPNAPLEVPDEFCAAGAKLYNAFTQVTTSLSEVLDKKECKDKGQLVEELRSCIDDIQGSPLTPLLGSLNAQDSSAATKRIAGKVDRALERLRRTLLLWIDRFSTSTAQETVEIARTLLQSIANTLDEVLKTTVSLKNIPGIVETMSDMTSRILDTLFALAKLTLNIRDPRTYNPAYDQLTKAITVLNVVSESRIPCPLGNYLRCLSGAHYNFAGSLYQAGLHGQTILFLKEACKIGGQALARRGKEKMDAEEKPRDKEGWKQLDETLFRRWELLGICYVKIGDRKNAFSAFVRSIKSFPFHIYDLAKDTNSVPPHAIFMSPITTPQFKQLAALIDRISYLGLDDLLMPPSSISLRQLLRQDELDETAWDSRIIGVLVEQQVAGLEQRSCKQSMRNATRCLIEDALEVYHAKAEMPVRRARVMLRLLEACYRMDNAPKITEIQDMAKEIDNLLLQQNLGVDLGLSSYRSQYRASAHLWLTLHSHRTTVGNQVSVVAQHIDNACHALQLFFKSNHSPKASKLKQPTTKTTTQRKRAATTIATAVNKTSRTNRKTTTITRKVSTTKKPDPSTPPSKPIVLQPVLLNVTNSPRMKIEPTTSVISIDNFTRLLSLLQTVARVLGLLSLNLHRIQLLDITRKLAEAQSGTTSEGYIIASLDLAYEYARIGKTRRATVIFDQVLEYVRGGHVSDDISTLCLLRFAELLALLEDIPNSTNVYCEAMAISQRIDYDEKHGGTLQRIHARVRRLEKAALAAQTVAMIQHYKGDLTLSLDLMLQSLRLWNRAIDNLTRLISPPSKQPTSDSNPFDMSSLKEALSDEVAPLPDPAPKVAIPIQQSQDGLGLRISEGLFSILFELAHMYVMRGSAKEAEFFIKQARELARALNAPAMLSRALAKQGEIHLRLGSMQEGYQCFIEAGDLLKGVPTIHAAEVHKLCAEYSAKTQTEEDARLLYMKSLSLLEELDEAFKQYEGIAFGPRRSLGLSPNNRSAKDVIMPDILTSVLREHLWLLRDQNDDHFKELLERFISLPRSSLTKAEENSLLAKLSLHNVYLRFQSDLFLNSLAESPIAIPMGTSLQAPNSASSHDILNCLDQAESQFCKSLALMAQRGNVLDVRESVISLAIIKSFQTSMGRKNTKVNIMVSRLLDASAALTLRREMLEAIHHKFPRSPGIDDLQWPLITADGALLVPPRTNSAYARKHVNLPMDSENEDDEEISEVEGIPGLHDYWNSIRARYRYSALDSPSLVVSQVEKLPINWTVIHINVTEDKNTLFISRQEGGGGSNLVFSVPLKGRRDLDNGGQEEEYLTFDDAVKEFQEIIKLSNEGTRSAINIKPGDEKARVTWWEKRRELDLRLKNLLENIEFCWFGAFKTILSPRCNTSPEVITSLKSQFERVFKQALGIQNSKRMDNHKKTSTQPQIQQCGEVQLDDTLLKCFSMLSPKCKDEEIEDLVYFILDFYQFHGVAVPFSEIDITHLVIDVRAILEEHGVKQGGQKRNGRQENTGLFVDEHLFLVLDKNLQGLPWESIPILRGRSVSRIPSLDFLMDRLEYADLRRKGTRTQGILSDGKNYAGVPIDPRKGYFILNPSGDLKRTEGRFRDWAEGMKKVGWTGVVGKPVSEQQFGDALRQSDLLVYFGHGGGEQYLRSYKIRRLQCCAATMLWGCSSGALQDMGDFDRTGTANAYMLGGCPTLVANLWDVTDRDIDKFSQAVFDKIKLTPDNIKDWESTEGNGSTSISIVTAVAQARSVCKLKYLTGAAPVVYGIPFYL